MRRYYNMTKLAGEGLRPERSMVGLTQSVGWRPLRGGIVASRSYENAFDIITNGTFAGDASGWTVVSPWSYSLGGMTHATGGTGTLAQGGVGSLGVDYYVQFTVLNRTAGTVKATLGVMDGTVRSADGVYAETITMSGVAAFALNASSDFDGDIKNVSVVPATVAPSWPFPQVFRLAGASTVALLDTTGYEVDENDWSASALTVKDIVSGLDDTITSGGVWHMCDMGKAWMAFNGSCIVFRPSLETMLAAESEVTYVVDSSQLSANTGCFHNGRWLMGGLHSSDFWTSDWETFWATYAGARAGVVTSVPMAENMVYWSLVGGGDLFALFQQSYGEDGYLDSGHGSDSPLVFDWLMRGDSGFMPMPWKGAVLAMKPLGRGIAVYGEGGVSVLTPIIDPMPGYGLTEVSRVGIYDRGSVCGDKDGHIFMDVDGKMWGIDSSFQMKELGYEEFTEDFDGGEMCACFEPRHGEYYFSDGSTTLVFGRYGAYEAQFAPTAFEYDGSSAKAVLGWINANRKRTLYMSDVLGGDGNRKTLTSTIVTGDSWENGSVTVYPKQTMQDDTTTGPTSQVNQLGEAHGQAHGHKFDIEVEADASHTGRIHSLGAYFDVEHGRWATSPTDNPDRTDTG